MTTLSIPAVCLRRTALSCCYTILFLLTSVSLHAQWQPKLTPIKTPWTSLVDPNNPLPEYPRPQMTRTQWMNLNGYWEFSSGAASDAVPHNQTLSGKIVVPYPVESTLSGVTKHYDRLWYRRMITVPAAWSGKRILIHFGAIDWESEVFVNGTSMGIHKGGYDEVTYDITDQLIGSGPQEIIVRVYDPTKDYGQPRGKQTSTPDGIMYTCTSGIWQTVWLEPVAPQYISALKLVPDIDNNCLRVTVNTPNGNGLTTSVTAKDGSALAGSVNGNANAELVLPLPNAKLWSPESPFLYDLAILIKNGTTVLDSVTSYAGMRKIAIDKSTATPKVYLNNKPIFMMGPLDQGFWPDGIYTAPTDEALRSDIEMEKALGFNMVRKHIKVEPQRWYYWADKLGILVWQDMPSANSYDGTPNMPTDQDQFNLELARMVNTHVNSPSIVMWVIFNEFQGQFDAVGRCAYVKGLDPTRLTNQGSGDLFGSAGDILDGHSYSPPSVPYSTQQAVVCGEYGGVGLAVANHLWGATNNPYITAANGTELTSIYSGYANDLVNFKTYNGMSGAVYTEITDVEGEINGFLTYDRILKVDAAQVKAINEHVIGQVQMVLSQNDVLPTSNKSPQQWKYTTSAPPADWNSINFSDNSWASGAGGFGNIGNPGTSWSTSDIWLRKTFNPGNLSAADIQQLVFSVFHDDDCEIYINGILAARRIAWTTGYMTLAMSAEAKNALISNGNNVLAVHCVNIIAGQFIDVGIVKANLSPAYNAAQCIKPVDKSGNIDVNVQLQWNSDALVTSHKIYFGVSPVLTTADLKATQAATSHSLTGLMPATNYYWRIDEVTPYGNIPGAVWKFTTRNDGVAVVYGDCAYGGTAIALDAGAYTLAQLNTLGILNDDISSMKVLEGFKVVLYANDNFGGMSKTLTQNSDCFVTLDTNWNDIVTSIKVVPNGVANMAGIYVLQNRNSGLYMDVTGGTDALADGANIQQYLFMGKPNQQFQFTSLGDGVYKITAMHSMKVLDVNAISKEDFANVQQWTYNATPNQQFVLVHTTGDFYKLIAKHSGKLLEVANASMTPEAHVQQYTNNDQTCGQWNLSTDLLSGLEDGLTTTDLIFYPNPVSSLLTIHTVGVLPSNFRYVVYDVTCRPQLSGMIENGSVNVELLPSGVYFIELSGDNISLVKKFIKK